MQDVAAHMSLAHLCYSFESSEKQKW